MEEFIKGWLAVSTSTKEMNGFIDKSSAILFLDNVGGDNGDVPWTQASSILADCMQSVLSSCHKYKVGSPFCIFICNLLYHN